MAATGKVIGTVTAVVGEAKATAADGTVRILQVGDAVHSDEVISTSAAGSINVALANGKTLDCGGDADLALHQGLLDVGIAAAPASAPASDIEAIQRVIVAGQDPSLVAPATAAGGAPAAGGADEGGAHNPVVIEQSNAASVVSSGFSTEGDSITFLNQVPQALPGVVVVAQTPAPVVSNSEQHAPVFSPVADDHSNASASIPAATTPVFETPVVAANEPSPSNQPVAPLTGDAPATIADAPSAGNQPEAPVTADAPITVADSTPNTPAELPQPPVAQNEPSTPTTEQPSTPSEEPVIVASNDDQPGDQQPPSSEQPSTPAEEPIIVASNDDQPGNEQQPPVVQTSDETPPVVVNETPSDVPETTLPGTVALDFTISANSNQDEQIGRLLFQNGENSFETLVFFGQEGQQKPTAVTLQFDLTQEMSTVKLQYIDAFAGNSDDGTGHTAQKIAVKDFGLSIDGVSTVLVQENDGVNIGIGNKTLMSEGTVGVDMSTGQAGDWSFANQVGSNGIDILDLTGTSLNLANVAQNAEVINLKGSAAQELTLNAADVLNVSDGSNVLHIVGGKEDSLKLDSSWTVHDGDASAAGTQAAYFGWVQVTHNDGATLLVDPDVQIKGAMMG